MEYNSDRNPLSIDITTETLREIFPTPEVLAGHYHELCTLAELSGSSEEVVTPDGVPQLLSPLTVHISQTFEAMEAINDKAYTQMLVAQTVEHGGKSRDDAYLLIGTYLRAGLWPLEDTALLLKTTLDRAETDNDFESQGLKHLVVDALMEYVLLQMKKYGEAEGREAATAEFIRHNLPVELVDQVTPGL